MTDKVKVPEELKPCPFCGSTKLQVYIGHYASYIKCECEAEGPSTAVIGNKESAIAAWNMRSPATLSTAP